MVAVEAVDVVAAVVGVGVVGEGVVALSQEVSCSVLTQATEGLRSLGLSELEDFLKDRPAVLLELSRTSPVTSSRCMTSHVDCPALKEPQEPTCPKAVGELRDPDKRLPQPTCEVDGLQFKGRALVAANSEPRSCAMCPRRLWIRTSKYQNTETRAAGLELPEGPASRRRRSGRHEI